MQKDFIFYLKRITGFILLLALSAVFLFSAITKLLAIEPFEWTFIDLFSLNFTGAAIVARLFIGLEIAIGLFLLAHLLLRSFTYKAAFALLAVLTGYLVLLIIRQGNTGDCGCFGEAYRMTPLAGIGKNVLMMGAVTLLHFIYPVALIDNKNSGVRILAKILPFVLPAIAFSTPYIISPLYIFSKGEVAHEPIKLEAIYTLGEPKPAVDLIRGKHIVAYLSLTCPHCRKAAFLIQILHRQRPELPFYLVLNGRKSREAAFFGETKAASVPYSIMRDVPAFSAMAGEYVPSIYWINNSIIERKTYYNQLDVAAIKEWMLSGK